MTIQLFNPVWFRLVRVRFSKQTHISHPGLRTVEITSGNRHLEFARQFHPHAQGVLLPDFAKCGSGAGANASNARTNGCPGFHAVMVIRTCFLREELYRNATWASRKMKPQYRWDQAGLEF